jgi:hypothetical protein
MNSKVTVLAVMKDVQGLREHDRKTGQDARWQGLDKVPDAALHSLKMHGGRMTHEVLGSNFSNSTTTNGVKINTGTAIVRFNIFGSDEGEPVTDEAWSMDTNKGDNASAKVYKRALRTFFVDLLQLPDDRAEPGVDLEVPERDRYLVKRRRPPKPNTRYSPGVADIPWSPRTEALGARIAFLTLDEYAVEWAKYYLDALSTDQHTIAYRFLVTELQDIGFSDSEAEHGAVEALRSFGIDVDTEKDLGVSSE